MIRIVTDENEVLILARMLIQRASENQAIDAGEALISRGLAYVPTDENHIQIWRYDDWLSH